MFDVTVNGTQVLTDFDIYAAAGGASKAVDQQFSVTADDTGTITVEFVAVTGYAQINGLEVLSGGSSVLAVNAGLLAGGTITIEPSSFLNEGTVQAGNRGTLNLARSTIPRPTFWSNTGTIGETNATLNLGGSFTTAGVGNLERTGGTVNLVGTLDNTGATLTLNATTGSWDLVGGILENGTYTASGALNWWAPRPAAR